MDQQETEPAIAGFIARWRPSGGAENANAQSFLAELCDLLEVPRPEPAREEVARNRYCFERDVTFQNPDGTTSHGRIDLYKKGCFVCESKQAVDRNRTGQDSLLPPRGRRKQGMAVRGAAAWISAMAGAKGQAESYVRALPADEGRPPFIMVVDVGYCMELYAEFSCTGGTYLPFPDPAGYRINLDDLQQGAVRDLLRTVWLEPMTLDPSGRSARVTREIADRLAILARSLEAAGHPPEDASGFLMRCLFTMFAEDVGLLPSGCFTDLLRDILDHPETFADLVEELWRTMQSGGVSAVLRGPVLRFNGGLFEEARALPLDREQIALLLCAARADWRDVEPAIFGTLLERALAPEERHRLGAHYTPRSYVERLVLPAVVDPLRREWDAVKASAVEQIHQGREQQALRDVTEFHRTLCRVRVLDPACGTGNFLYVCLEHFKRLEGEVLDLEARLAGQQHQRLDVQGLMVDPHQFIGLEVNPRAAAIAELVLWIGHLQWHLRARGRTERPPEPVLRRFGNILCRDALLTWDGEEAVLDEHGAPRSRWDGRTMRRHPATGEPVPDETARVPVLRLVNPRPAPWPRADYVVGNPPFIGASHMLEVLGPGYTDALRSVWSEVPASCDLVMYWWHMAAELLRRGAVQRFGFITTNTIRQAFNRRVLARHMGASPPLSLVHAVPDHPWVDAAGSADVRIAMTVARQGRHRGLLQRVVQEFATREGPHEVAMAERRGLIHPDLSVGPDVVGAVPLRANQGLSCPGVKLHGKGFQVSPEQARELGLGRVRGLERHIRDYRNGRDLAQRPRGVMVIDLYGLDAETARDRFPAVYQWVRDRVKPERDQNNRRTYREHWWLFGEPRGDFRPALRGLSRYIATVETSKHRFFTFLDAAILPDNKLVAIALEDAFFLGVLSSRVHVGWALAGGGRLGVGNDPVYVKTRCFETFPFPEPGPALRARIRDLAEQLDAHRKARQAEHPGLTVTAMYNVREKLRAGESLDQAEQRVYRQGLVRVLDELHQDLDAAVLQAYGWSAEMESVEILERLAELNMERAAEEAGGRVRWLRPGLQRPEGAEELRATDMDTPAAARAAAAPRRPWPRSGPEQARAALEALQELNAPAAPEELAAAFSHAHRGRLARLLDAMAVLGQARKLDNGRFLPG
jgi:hypothetical protein